MCMPLLKRINAADNPSERDSHSGESGRKIRPSFMRHTAWSSNTKELMNQALVAISLLSFRSLERSQATQAQRTPSAFPYDSFRCFPPYAESRSPSPSASLPPPAPEGSSSMSTWRDRLASLPSVSSSSSPPAVLFPFFILLLLLLLDAALPPPAAAAAAAAAAADEEDEEEDDEEAAAAAAAEARRAAEVQSASRLVCLQHANPHFPPATSYQDPHTDV
mmetsp:Transcript_39056/g.76832  ORF Transcript_39056/g.76832 Transcript_39056/m.76832 type:complete len:220 (+) Transcript_39056:187-846(+)